jgi:predicted metal-dependent hydrolase
VGKPTIVMTGTPTWADEVRKRLESAYEVVRYVERAGYVARLTDARAALILVSAEQNWKFWTATPKSSPATRRIPIVLASDDAETRAEALLSGADVALSTTELLDQIETLVKDYARVLDLETIEQLDCECDETLPPMAQQGVEKFNAGEYYKQHDLFEALWVKTEGPVRDLYRAILQVGIAYYQIERGNPRGALKMLLRSVQWLSILPDVCQGVDVGQLREDSYRVRAELERLGEAHFAEFDPRLVKPVRWVNEPSKK